MANTFFFFLLLLFSLIELILVRLITTKIIRMTTHTNELRLYYQNVRGIRTKTDIRKDISASGYDVICFTEHWLNNDFNNGEYFDDSYFVERSDRNRIGVSRGGGALIAIKNFIAYKRYHEWENESSFDNVWIQIKTNSHSHKLFVNLVYIEPETRYTKYEEYLDSLTAIMCSQDPNTKFLILGDFNLAGSVEWFFYNNECLPLTYEGDIANEFINTLAINELKQLNYLRNNINRTLDLALTNTDDFIFSPVPHKEELSKIDCQHPPFQLNFSAKDIKFMEANKSVKLNYFKANYELINSELEQVDWNEVLDINDIDVQIDQFYRITRNIIERFTPTILPKNSKYPKWFSSKLIELIRDKNFYFDKLKKTNNQTFYTLYKNKRKHVKYELRACESNYTKSIENSIKTNTKAFFAYTKSLNKSNKLPNIMKLNNESSDNPETIANYFAQNFQSVYSPVDYNIQLPDYTCNCNEHLVITDELICNVIKCMDENKTNSPDGIPTLFYKKTMLTIVTPLKILFNNSLCQRQFPEQWKLSLLTPLYKNGDKSDILNYRPISIISAISKIFEKIIYLSLLNDVEHLINSHQHGFVRHKSTITNLAEYVNFLSSNIAKGGQIDSIYTDFAKAFDKVNHRVLMNKLDQFPINNCIKSWIYSFLTNRQQIVCVYGSKSNAIRPTSSVPQGCILSPLLFSLFINDLPTNISSSILLFADDCKIFRLIKSIEDCRTLQNDITKLTIWCNENKLLLNANKCSVVSFTRRTVGTFEYFSYKINNTTLNRNRVIKDLGILFDEKLSFSNHVKSIVTRASKSMGFICRSLKPFTIMKTHTTLFNTYVRSILEYGSPIWNPYYDKYTRIIENVQRKFTRILCYKFGIPRETYEERLISLNMQSLYTRRLYFDETLLYKIVVKKLNTTLNHSFNINIPLRVTRFAPIFYVPSVSTNIQYFSLALRLKRQHNDHFSMVDLQDNHLKRTLASIKESLPNELWPNFR